MNRFERFAKAIQGQGLDAVLLQGEANRFYATGFPTPTGDALCLIGQDGTAYYFTDSRYLEAAEATITGASLEEVRRGRGYLSLCREMLEKHGWKRIGFEDSVMTVQEWKQYQTLGVDWQPASQWLEELRMVKTEEELAAIRTAQKITELAYLETLNEIRVGRTEKEIAAFLQYRMLSHGAEGMSFAPIVASGANSSVPHAVPTDKTLQTGEFITMDFGCVWQGYCSDMTRTVAIGSVTEEMERVYQIVLQAQKAGIATAKAGATGAEVDQAARAVITQNGYGEYFGHSFGHGIGVVVHESPNATIGNLLPMPAHAVISAEPGIYLPRRFGVRIEDMLHLIEGGCENLTHADKQLLRL